MSQRIPRILELSAIALLCAAVSGCKSSTQTETETHFLANCDADCPSGLSCVCGACTEPCSSDTSCARFTDATCVPTSSDCGGEVASACDVECAGTSDCGALGTGFTCADGRCRIGPTSSGGAGGASGGGGTGAGGGSAGAGTGGSATGGNGGSAGQGTACGNVGEPCCDPFPSDGPNYCLGTLVCGGDGCVDCDCALGAYMPVCGTDGVTYDSACGSACVPVPVACTGECPCQCIQELGTGCAGALPGDPNRCCGDLACCEGVPYNPSGECRPECNFVSDRDAKTDIQPADTSALLESVAALPISTWSYHSEPSVRHVGPMAQDFAASFGFGSSDRVIAGVDASGVALASIQALNARVEKLARDNAALERRIQELEASSGASDPKK